MGLLRKTLFVGSGGLVNPNSKKQRVAKQQLKATREIANGPRGAQQTMDVPLYRHKVLCPECRTDLVSAVGPNIACPECGALMGVTYDDPLEGSTEPARPALRMQPMQPPPTGEPSTLAAELERLAELHRTGALSDDEFGAAKAKLLSG